MNLSQTKQFLKIDEKKNIYCISKPNHEIEKTIYSSSKPSNSYFIPHLFSLAKSSPTIKYTTYKMELLGNMFKESNRSVVFDKRLHTHFMTSLKFILNTLCCLDYIHTTGYVHGDISGSKIYYKIK